MAYGLKYFSRYKDIHGVIKEIRFLKIDFAGPAKEWHNTYGACDIDQGSSDAFFDKPIVTSQARISLYLEEQYDLSEFVYDRKTFFCQRVIPALGATPEKIEWTGWLEPWDAARPYKKPPWTVSLTASCGLAHLSKKKYVNPDNTFKKTGLKLIQECLEIIGSELGLRVSTHMYENSWIGDPEFGLASFEINTARYYDSNGEAMYCDEIVNDILDYFDAELTQWDNRWVVRSIVDHATGFEPSYQELTFQDGPAVPASPWPGTYVINDTDAFSVDGGEIRILAPITKYRIEVDMGPQMPYFQNGNMVLWTDSGLVGWDFTHMPKGNPGWEQYHVGGDPEAASVLKINGIAPGPYQKKRKKKLAQIMVNIHLGALGVIGAVSNNFFKNKYQDVEPTEWIESSAGKISKGDKSLKISFDYETAAFSGDVIIAIRMPSVRPPYTVWWFWPGMANSGITDEFKFIIVPAIDREGLIYKSTINVAGNPNYPDGFLINWTYIVTGVPAGQVRRIGGVSGIPVENGDLIVSKITNPGGTQAAVGANWDVINIRNNTKKGTFEVDINLEKINLISDTDPDRSLPIPEVFVRFYKISHHEGKTGDWYKIYNLKGELEGFVATDDASRYATTLERGSKTDEEAETIHHITGDYNPWFSGSLTLPGSDENTKSWRRRPDLNESLSIYRASMLDRLCMTSRPLDILQGEITLLPGAPFLSYLHTLVLKDRGNMRMRIVRYSYNDYSRKAKVTAIQAKYEEIPVEELRQDSYIPGSRLLNSVPGQGDGVYPTKQDSSNGRLSTDDVSPTVEDLADAASVGGRLGAIFDITEPLTYIVGIESEDSVDLVLFVSEAFNELNEDQEPEDQFDISTLEFAVTEKPVWLTDVTIVFLVITATALAPKAGTYFLYYDVTDPESGLVFPLKVPIEVTSSPDFAESWPPVFTDLPNLYFTVDLENTDHILLSDFMDSEHAEALGYTFRILESPGWVSDQSVIFMDLSVTGKPTTEETKFMLIEIKDSIGRTYLFPIRLIAILAPVVTGELLDTTSGVVVHGPIPASYELLPRIDVQFTISGKHDAYEATLNGGGLLGDFVSESISVSVAENDSGTYRVYGTTGIIPETGQYELIVIPKIHENPTPAQIIDFVLYDDDYLDLIQNAFLLAGLFISYILTDGTSLYENDGEEYWNLTSEISGVEHDKVTQKLYSEPDGVLIKTEVHDLVLDLEYGVYQLDSSTIARDPGKYRFVTELELDTDVVIVRTVRFEVASPKDECCGTEWSSTEW